MSSHKNHAINNQFVSAIN